MTAAAVHISGVHKRFGDHVALEDIDLVVNDGEFVSLLGPSGCGKTTLLRIVSGFERPTSGRVLIQGRDVTEIPPDRRPTNIVFQRGALFPHMNVFDNIGYSLKLRGWSKPRIAQRVEEMLALVRLDGLEGRGPTELSGGQIQRAALARALAAEPSVLLLDEPLSALDLKLRQHMQLELRAIQRKLGATFLYVTHDQTEALVMSDRIAVMNEGRVVQEGSPREIYSRPASVFASDFIGETNLMVGRVISVEDDLVSLRLGAESQITGSGVKPLLVGEPAILSVRPEAIRIRPAGSATSSEDAVRGRMSAVAGGRIVEVIYLGNRTRLEVEVPGANTVLADLRDDETAGVERGLVVDLEWPASAATVWPVGPDVAAT